jgi:hypothetical protein
MNMQASDAGWLLNALAKGGVVELDHGRAELIDALQRAELVRRAPDARDERRRLDQLKGELAKIAGLRAKGIDAAEVVGRERGLRTAIIELSERCAEIEAATEVRIAGGGGPYRGGSASGDLWQLTQKGRTLLGDLAPRAARIGPMTVEEFQAQMTALRHAFEWRAGRAAQIASHLKNREMLGRARLATPIGLSAARGEPALIARSFDVAFENLRRTPMFSVEQDAATAEALCLGFENPSYAEHPQATSGIHALRVDILSRYAHGNPEDAVDAALMLGALDQRQREATIAKAAQLALALAQHGKPISLPLALIATAGNDEVPDHLPIAIKNLASSIGPEVTQPNEALAVAVLIAFPRGDLNVQIDKWRTLRQYLARFAPEGMAIAAGLLAWVALEPAELLDNLRHASAALKKYRLVNGGAETMTLATKLLVNMSVLASGNEGDHEEQLKLAPVAHPRVPHLGLHGSLTALPVIGSAVVAFHRTVLDAAAAWEAMYQPTHSSYVFGSGSSRRRSYGWG